MERQGERVNRTKKRKRKERKEKEKKRQTENGKVYIR